MFYILFLILVVVVIGGLVVHGWWSDRPKFQSYRTLRCCDCGRPMAKTLGLTGREVVRCRECDRLVWLDDHPHVQTIEKTGKRWKFYKAVGVGAFVGAMFSGWLTGRYDIAIVLLAMGVVLLLVAELGRWWYHG